MYFIVICLCNCKLSTRLTSLYSDVIYLPLCSLLQTYYLHHYSSSLSEHYWSLSRSYLAPPPLPPSLSVSCEALAPSAPHTFPRGVVKLAGIVGLLDTVLVPWINEKLKEAHSDQYHGEGRVALVRLYPYLNLLMALCNTLLKAGYLLRFTDHFSIVGVLLGLRYTSSSPSSSSSSSLRRLVELAFPLAMFYVQFVRQWSSIEQPSPYHVNLAFFRT